MQQKLNNIEVIHYTRHTDRKSNESIEELTIYLI